MQREMLETGVADGCNAGATPKSEVVRTKRSQTNKIASESNLWGRSAGKYRATISHPRSTDVWEYPNTEEGWERRTDPAP